MDALHNKKSDIAVEARIDQEALARRVQFTNAITRIVFPSLTPTQVLYIGVWLLAPEYTQLLMLAVFTIPMTLGCLAYPWFRDNGRASLGFVFFLSSIGFALFTTPFAIPSILIADAIGYCVLIVLSNLLLGDRFSRWILGIAAIGLAINVLFSQEVFDRLFVQVDPTVERVFSTLTIAFSFTASALVLRYVVLMQDTQFRLAQRANIDLEQRSNVIDMQRVQLELSNAEIEAQSETEQNQRMQLEALVSNVQMLISNLRDTTTNIEAEAREQMARATEQDAAVTQTAATVDEVISTVHQVADRAQHVAQTAQKTVDVSQRGQSAVADSVTGLERVEDRVQKIAQTIQMLAGNTQQISEIINTVSDIADQSKLLAINAAIEAARAGEDARGFNVVAMEVRQLADQSHEATTRVNAILHDIQSATDAAVKVTVEGTEEAQRSRALAEEVSIIIQELALSLETAAEAAVHIAASTQQQTNAMDQLAAATHEIKQTSQQNASGAHQIEQSIRFLGDLSEQLEQAAVSG